MDKYQLIDSITVQVDALVDMRGTEKCRTALEIVSKLSALRNGLAQDDKAHVQQIEAYTERIAALTAPSEDEETIEGKTYKIGEVRRADPAEE